MDETGNDVDENWLGINEEMGWYLSILVYSVAIYFNHRGNVFILLFKIGFSKRVLFSQTSMLFCGTILLLIIGFVPHFRNIILSFKSTFSWSPSLFLPFCLLHISDSFLDAGVLTPLLISHKDEASVSAMPGLSG